jgi:protein involved in polysaccharide export with SLBB domain
MSMALTRILSVFLILFILIPVLMSAQDLGNINFTSLKADDLTDAQIQQLYNRLQSEGISLSEFEGLAIARGAQATEVSKLRSRLNRLRTDTEAVSETETRALRAVDRATDVDFVTQNTTGEAQERIFGLDLFRDRSRTFQPSFNIPTPKDYTLGPGDILVIDIWGGAEANYRLQVSPEGSIRIANLGPIHVNGMSIDLATTRIIQLLSTIYSGLRPNNPSQANTFAQVSLGNVRSIKVTVMGEVSQPGTYTVTSLSTVFNALYAAGGPTRNGTFRAIQVIRGREIVAELDVYDFLVYGDQTNNIRLEDQDIIKIDPYKNRIRLTGEVKRSGLFELLEGETFNNLLEFSGGFTERAYTERIVMRRKTGIQRSIQDIQYPANAEMVLNNGDEISIRGILDRFENRVTINGAVFRDGEYELDEGLTLSQLIAKAAGLREDAYFERGVIFRQRDDLILESISFNLRSVLNNPAEHDILLKRDDVVQISSLFDLREEFIISVSGAVNNGGEFPFVEQLTLKDAIYLANGFREQAAPYRIEIARRIFNTQERLKSDQIAELYQFSVDENLEFRGDDEDFQLKPFDQIFVRIQPNYTAQQTVQIRGEVQYPGTYVLSTRSTKISDLIEMAGGLSDYAYLRGASLTRKLANDNEVESILARIDSTSNANINLTSKVGIRLIEILQHQGSPDDLQLLPGDVLEIPRELQTVRIEGEVLFPASIRYDKRMSYRSYLDRAGGYTDSAKRKKVYVVYANGEVDRSRSFLFFTKYPNLEPGATIVVPSKPDVEKMGTQERILIYSAIVSMSAIITNTIFQIRRN